MKPKYHSARSLQICAISLAFAGISLLPSAALAASITWDGDTSSDFADGANWAGGTAPSNDTASDIATFNPAAPNQPNLSLGDRGVNGLDFQSGGWTLSGTNILSLGTGGITSTGVNAVQTNLNISSGAKTFSSATGGTLTINNITTGGTLTLGSTGNTGTVVLQGTVDNPSLSPTLAFGTLVVNKGDGNPTGDFGSATNNLTVNSGATVKFGSNLTSRTAGSGRGQIYGTATVNGTMDLNGQGMTSATTNNWIMGGLAGSGDVINNGAGAAQLGVRGGTFTGNINNGTNTTSLLVASGTFNWSGLGNFSGDIITNGILNFTGLVGGGSYAKTITGTGGLTFSTAGIQTLTGPNTYSGLTTIATGATVLVGTGQANSLGATTGALTLTTGSTLDLNGNNLTKGTFLNSAATGTVTSVAPAKLIVNYNTAAAAWAGTSLTGAASLVVNSGSGGTNEVFGTGVIVNGSGYLGFQNMTGAVRFNNIAVNLGTNGDLVFNGSGQISTTVAQTFAAGSDIVVNGLANYWNYQNTTLVPGNLTGTGDLKLTIGGGNKLLTLAGNNTGYSGTLTYDASIDRSGTLSLASNTTIGLPLANVVLVGNTSGSWNNTILQYAGTNSAIVPLGALGGTNPQTFVQNATAATTATFQIGSLNKDTSYPGVIRDSGTALTALEKVGSGTLTLGGLNLYTGPTAVTTGTLNVTGSLGATACTVAPAATLVVANGSPDSITAGNNATVSMVDGTIGFLTIDGASGVTLGGASAGQKSNLKFEAGASTSDSVAISNALTVNAGGANITITPLGIAAGQNYTLASFGNGAGAGFTTGSGTTVGALTLTNPAISFGVNGTLQVSANFISLVTTGSAAPANAYWSGIKGSNWNSNSSGQGNFTTTATGVTYISANPGANTNVFFSNNTASNLTHTLGENFGVNGITYRSGSAAVSTSGSNQLTIGAGGITVESSNGGATLGMSSLILSESQAWTNNSANPLVVSAAVSGPIETLTLAGSGGVKLGGATVTVDTLAVNSNLDLAGTLITASFLDSSGNITNSGANQTLKLSTPGPVSLSGVISDGAGTIAVSKSGGDSLTLGNANSYSGVTAVTAGSVVLGNATALGSIVGNTTLASGTTLDLNGQTIAEPFGSIAGAKITNSSATAAAITGNITSGGFTLGGTGDITLSDIDNGSNFVITKVDSNTLWFSGDGIDNARCGVNVTFGTAVLDKPNTSAANKTLYNSSSVATGALLRYGTNASGGNQIFDGAQITVNGTFDMYGKSDTIGGLAGTDVAALVTNSQVGSSTLSVGGTTSTASYDGSITDGGAGKVLALTKVGTGVQTLTGPVTCTGGTMVTAGTLSLATATLSDTSNVTIALGAVLNLTHSSTDLVGSLTVNNNVLVGTFDENSPETAGYITGPGKIQVGAASGYSSWATTNAGGQTPGQDYDNDGVSNGIEYFMNSAPGFTANPGLSGGTVTWPNGLNIPFGAYGTQFVVQTSANLSTWTDVLSSDLNLNNTMNSVSYTPAAGQGKTFIRLVVTPN